MDSLIVTSDEMPSFVQGNVEAIMRSGRTWAVGWQALSQTMAVAARAYVDHTISTCVTLAGAKSFHEAMVLRSDYASKCVGDGLAETSRLTSESLKLVEQAMAPIAARMTLGVERMSF